MNGNEEVNVPAYSFWPLFLAIGFVMIAIGIVWTIGISILGLLIMISSIIGWVWENRTAEMETQNE